MAEEFKKEAAFVGVSNNDTVEDGKSYQEELGVPYPLSHAPAVWDQFNVPYQPVTIVLSSTGEQIERIDGPITYEGLKQILVGATT